MDFVEKSQISWGRYVQQLSVTVLTVSVMQIYMSKAINCNSLQGIYKPPHIWVIVWSRVNTINTDVATDNMSQDGQTCPFNLLHTNRGAIMWRNMLLEGRFTFLEKNQTLSVDKKNQLGVTFCILYFSSNSCSTCFAQPCARHQKLTTAWYTTYQHKAITSRSRQLLMMGTLFPETCWATIRIEIRNTKCDI